ncbi:hypothetical protein LJC57_09425 [Parabacteroides sp. OttesenSCG-928-G07]|nr:hypothetical protein [Parabacteroides sp. OttesenSCG-928-G21]MDL2278798.1 hypothetical protein [Parabacteroides sp. OttesenSCG-928-G07]
MGKYLYILICFLFLIPVIKAKNLTPLNEVAGEYSTSTLIDYGIDIRKWPSGEKVFTVNENEIRKWPSGEKVFIISE